jgi:hypothetical protein
VGDTPNFHGWGFDDAILSVAPHPARPNRVALIMSLGDEHEVMAEFATDDHAQRTMDFLDGAFRMTSKANAHLIEIIRHG